ncbi:MAG: hypothetical protein Pars2KO_32770 [Parasphingorhabdus sp.]
MVAVRVLAAVEVFVAAEVAVFAAVTEVPTALIEVAVQMLAGAMFIAATEPIVVIEGIAAATAVIEVVMIVGVIAAAIGVAILDWDWQPAFSSVQPLAIQVIPLMDIPHMAIRLMVILAMVFMAAMNVVVIGAVTITHHFAITSPMDIGGNIIAVMDQVVTVIDTITGRTVLMIASITATTETIKTRFLLI